MSFRRQVWERMSRCGAVDLTALGAIDNHSDKPTCSLSIWVLLVSQLGCLVSWIKDSRVILQAVPVFQNILIFKGFPHNLLTWWTGLLHLICWELE